MLSMAGAAAADDVDSDAATVSDAGNFAAVQAARAATDSSARAGSGMDRMIRVLSVRRHGDREVGRRRHHRIVATGVAAIVDVEDVVVRRRRKGEAFVWR